MRPPDSRVTFSAQGAMKLAGTGACGGRKWWMRRATSCAAAGGSAAAARMPAMHRVFRENDISVPPSAACSRLLLDSEEHTSELQSLMRISYAVFCLQKKN